MNPFYHAAKFMMSAPSLDYLPLDEGYEIAFAGRSNSGKSSTLNTLCTQKTLAKTSKTPGRTQLINLFQLDAQRRLVDLPGYGYAKVSRTTKERWQETLAAYLEQRQCLQGVFLIMDIRHPLKELDQNFIAWTTAQRLPLHILLNKCDKLSRNQAHQALIMVKNHLLYHPEASTQLFSAHAKTGLDEAYATMDRWLDINM